MKRWVKNLLLTLLVIVLLIAALVIWQWNNVVALVHFSTHSTEELAQDLSQSKQQLQALLWKQSPSTLRDFTPEEEKQILAGTLSPEEALAKLQEEKASETPVEAPPSGEKNPNGAPLEKTPAPSASKVDQVISAHVGQLYGVKAQFISQLGQLEARAKADYMALPQAERNLVSKESFVGKYAAYANSLEAECDGKVSKILENLKADLKANGGDVSVVKTIQSSYNQEKAVKKAYYLSLINQ